MCAKCRTFCQTQRRKILPARCANEDDIVDAANRGANKICELLPPAKIIAEALLTPSMDVMAVSCFGKSTAGKQSVTRL
jgi:hypothetical protein